MSVRTPASSEPSVAPRPRVRDTLAAAAPMAVLLFAVAAADAHVARVAWLALALLLLAAMTACDLRTRRVPNALVYPALALAAIVPAAFGARELLIALEGGALSFAAMLALALAGRGAMGMADVKVMTFCGLVLGPGLALAALALAAVGGAAVAAVLLVSRRAHRGDAIPLVPFLAAAAAPLLVVAGRAP